ncbi:MAG: hypothetical protein ACFFED_11820 [Candidatus Thorarchaeota archaeon]
MSPKPNYVPDRERQMGKEGNVPILISDLASFEFVIIFGFVMIAPVFYREGIDLVGFIVLWPLSILICWVALYVLHIFQKRRYRVICEDQEIGSMVAQATQRLGYQKYFEIWIIPTITQVLIPLYTLTSRALVISEGAIEDILAQPDEGEVVLANAIGDLANSFFLHVKIPIILGFTVTLTTAWLSLEVLELKIPLAYLGVLVFILLQAETDIRGPRILNNPTVRIYHIHPDIARIHVFRGDEPTEEEQKIMRERVPGTRPPNPHKRSIAIAFVASVAISILVGYLSYAFLFSMLALPSSIAEGLDLLGPLLVYFLLFEVLFVGYTLYLKGQEKKQSNQEEWKAMYKEGMPL